MKLFKNILLSIVLITLLVFNIYLLILCSRNVYLREQVAYHEKLLDGIVNESIEGMNLDARCIEDSVVIYSVTGEKQFLSDLLDSENVLFFRYNENSCGSCVDFIIPYIKEISKTIGYNKIVILASYEENRFLNIFKKKINSIMKFII